MLDTLNVNTLRNISENLDPQASRSLWEVAIVVILMSTVVVAAYIFYQRRKSKTAINSVNNIELISSIKDAYSTDTAFLIVSPMRAQVKLELLDFNEEPIDLLFDGLIEHGEQKVSFSPANHEAGIYYLYLSADSTKVLRKIKIS